MTTIDTTVEKDLKDLKDAVSAVVKANDAWLSALDTGKFQSLNFIFFILLKCLFKFQFFVFSDINFFIHF